MSLCYFPEYAKLDGIARMTAEAIIEITGGNTIYQHGVSLMRSGAPDLLDLMVTLN